MTKGNWQKPVLTPSISRWLLDCFSFWVFLFLDDESADIFVRRVRVKYGDFEEKPFKRAPLKGLFFYGDILGILDTNHFRVVE